jgi:hypothetical protein
MYCVVLCSFILLCGFVSDCSVGGEAFCSFVSRGKYSACLILRIRVYRMATRNCCFCDVSLQKPSTMAATVALPFSCAMRASPVSKVAGVVTNVRCSAASLETGMPIYFPSSFLLSL